MVTQQLYLINGSSNIAISPLDRGFAYGDGVFRTLKIVKGVPEHWPLHYQNLVADCAAIGIVCPSPELFIHDFQHLFSFEETAVAKIIVTRGESERGYSPPAITMPMRVVLKSDMPHYKKTHYTEGVHLHLCNIRLPIQPVLAGIKHLNRLENVLARMEWKDDLIFDGLLLDTQNNVIECTMSNLFARYKDQLFTPNLTLSGVAGITRQSIMNISKSLHLNVEVRQLTLESIIKADEVIICNSLYGAFQVVSLADKKWLKQNLDSSIRKVLAYD